MNDFSAQAGKDDLDTMLQMQRALQARINGYDIEDQPIELRIENIKLNVLALTAELHEALDETGWKPWASSRHIYEDRLQEELIDAWHFLMNLFLHANMDADKIFEMYCRKHGINVTRQEDGYEGVKEKCPQCHRDLAEMQLKEQITNIPRPHVILYCMCGHEVGRRDV
jgi:hypothetical protein